QHDILTGSDSTGRAVAGDMDTTCSNYTSNGDGKGSVMLGHHDRTGGGNSSWNSAHGSRGCSQPNLVATGGAGLLYCFAANGAGMAKSDAPKAKAKAKAKAEKE